MSNRSKPSLESANVPSVGTLKRLSLRRETVKTMDLRTGIRTGDIPVGSEGASKARPSGPPPGWHLSHSVVQN